jgi:hypothetical protein
MIKSAEPEQLRPRAGSTKTLLIYPKATTTAFPPGKKGTKALDGFEEQVLALISEFGEHLREIYEKRIGAEPMAFVKKGSKKEGSNMIMIDGVPYPQVDLAPYFDYWDRMPTIIMDPAPVDRIRKYAKLPESRLGYEG